MAAGRPNRRRRTMRIWLAVAAVSAFAALSPFLFEGRADFLDFNEAGGAVFSLGLLLAVTGCVSAAFYWRYARAEDQVRGAVQEDPSVLHRLAYTEEEWACFAGEAWRRDRSRMKSVWLLVAGITAALVPLIGLLTGDFAFAVLFALGLVAFLALFAFGGPLVRRVRMLRGPREVVFSRQGVVVGPAFLPFDAAMVSLEAVEFKDGWLSFTAEAPSRTGPQDWTVDVWVPERLRGEVDASLRAMFGPPPRA